MPAVQPDVLSGRRRALGRGPTSLREAESPTQAGMRHTDQKLEGRGPARRSSADRSGGHEPSRRSASTAHHLATLQDDRPT